MHFVLKFRRDKWLEESPEYANKPRRMNYIQGFQVFFVPEGIGSYFERRELTFCQELYKLEKAILLVVCCGFGDRSGNIL